MGGLRVLNIAKRLQDSTCIEDAAPSIKVLTETVDQTISALLKFSTNA